MNPESIENQKLQLEWCRCSTPAIADGARNQANSVLDELIAAGIEPGNILEIGPQNGYALEVFSKRAMIAAGIEPGNILEIGPQNGYALEVFSKRATVAAGLDVVPEFVATCTEKGLECKLGTAENLPDYYDGKWNFYLREVAEHFADREKAFKNIINMIDRWIYISIPIEPMGPRDKGHLSYYKTREELEDLLVGLKPLKEPVYRKPVHDVVGRLSGIWIAN